MGNFLASKEFESNFKSLVCRFRLQCKKEGLQFDEDIFSQTLLNCYEKMEGMSDLTEKAANNYLWQAFKNNTIRDTLYLRNRIESDEEIENYDVIDEAYNNDIDDLYQAIIDEISEKYSEKWCYMFQLHVEEDMPYRIISESYGISEKEIHNQFKNIRNHIRKKHKDTL